MPNLNTVLGEEIRRLARKEIRAQVGATQKTVAKYRSEIAELKRRISDLERRLNYVEKQEKKRLGQPASAEESGAKRPRFSPGWVKKHREKLGISAADYGQLVGVSGLTIYNWEKGDSNPREKQLLAWGEIRNLGKREALKRLEMLED
ncbi:helix-turn-helix domain-containing protein [Algisphaera agarilytica]|uniref:DNA-binding XRE family transcriptional regulator n=1 Tax=Algisphaera agarilytica TaxID=1385975 RepID=A0A7X0LJX4_9BACT|nr:helix-turn-helix domain-containing protein [Algisphaera agarilytica]MBB6429046.1 DNA-binding XRE family transcriptional regulator [Algisphaera agarilytica]